MYILSVVCVRLLLLFPLLCRGLPGGLTGSLSKVSGVLGDAAAMLTFDSEFQKDRKKASSSIGEGVEGAAKVGDMEVLYLKGGGEAYIWHWVALCTVYTVTYTIFLQFLFQVLSLLSRELLLGKV